MQSDGARPQPDGRMATLEHELQRLREQCRETGQRLDELTGLIDRCSAVVMRWRVVPGAWPVEYASEGVRQFGYTPEDFTSGRVSWPSITHPDDVPRLEAEVAGNTALSEGHFHLEYRILTHAGEARWIDAHTVAVVDAEGRLTHYEGFLLDITERKALEETLTIREAQMRLIIENTLTPAPSPISAHPSHAGASNRTLSSTSRSPHSYTPTILPACNGTCNGPRPRGRNSSRSFASSPRKGTWYRSKNSAKRFDCMAR